MATFTELDSGSSAASPVVYTAAAGPNTVQFVGGAVLAGLGWTAAGTGFPAGTLKATVPGTIQVDSQDQLFVADSAGERHPLVRARTPNGKPCTALPGSIPTVSTGLSWICVGIHSRRALPCPVCA